MKPNLLLRVSLALIAAVVIVAGGVTAGAQTLSRTEPIVDAEPVELRAESGPDSTEADAAAARQAADEARQLEYFHKLEAEAAYFKTLEEQAYFAALEQQAAAQAEADAAAQAAAEAAAARPAGVPDDSYWDRIATCETGGNWSMSGSRYSGGVGFANSTWNAWGGREFADNAGSATRDQQIVVANRVATQGYGSVAPVGYSGWGCARHSVGYP